MMAVTEVNGCRYCSYFHTQVSLRAGLKKDEIRRILEGEFEGAPQEELSALYFAQHYADSGGKPNPEAVQCLQDVYGVDGAKEIIAAADAYHAIRSDRPYRSGRTHAEAVPEMLRCAGTQFDPDVVHALLRALDSDDKLRGMVISPMPAALSSALVPDLRGALN